MPYELTSMKSISHGNCKVSHEVAQENHGPAQDADQEQPLAPVFGDAPPISRTFSFISSEETSTSVTLASC